MRTEEGGDFKTQPFFASSTLKQTNENEKQITPEEPGEEADAARRSAAEDRDEAGEESANATNANANAGAAAADPLADVELGLLIGQGAYGRVYRGIWNGAPVAVKVIPHLGPAAGGASAAAALSGGGKTSAGSGGANSHHGSGGAPLTPKSGVTNGGSSSGRHGSGGVAPVDSSSSSSGAAAAAADAASSPKGGAEGIRGALEMMHSVDLVSFFFKFSNFFILKLFFSRKRKLCARKKTTKI